MARKTRRSTVTPLLALGLALAPAAPVVAAESDPGIAMINEAAGSWTAADNPVWRLDPQERRGRLGLARPDLPPEPAPPPEVLALGTSASLPSSFDWRDAGGNFVSAVRNQGGCGSCWAFASAAALEAKALLAGHSPGADLDLSEQLLVSCSGGGSCAGGVLHTTAAFIRDQGVAVESCFPYNATDGLCASACAGWRDDVYRIDGYTSHYGTDPAARIALMKGLVYAGGPAVVAMDVYDDFYGYRSGVYRKTPGAAYEGGHAVLLVGWDDAAAAFIVKNSWGTWWGESGYFRIGYDQVAGDVDLGWWVVAYGAARRETTTPLADLRCRGTANDPVAVTGQPFSVRGLIANEGDAAAGASTAALYLSTDDDADTGDDWYVGEVPVAALAAGAASWVRWDFDTPDLGPGPVSVWPVLVADSGGAVAESAEGNVWKAGAPFVAGPSSRWVLATSPNGGEAYARGTRVRLAWESQGCPSVVLRIRRRARSFWAVRRVAVLSADAGEYWWTVPRRIARSERYRFRVTCAGARRVFDESDAFFRIY